MSGSGIVVFDFSSWAARYPELASAFSPPVPTGYLTDDQGHVETDDHGNPIPITGDGGSSSIQYLTDDQGHVETDDQGNPIPITGGQGNPIPSTGVGSGLADLYFLEAQLYLDNSLASPVPDVTIRGLLLNMLTAHIAALNAPLNGQPASTLVGRISNASEGSVSVATEMNLPGSAAWFAQTKYGVAFWQATANLRTARYIPGAGVRPRQGAYGPFSGPFGYRGGW